jgi:subtilisin family serine protease
LFAWPRRHYDPVIVSRILECAMTDAPCRRAAVPLLIATLLGALAGQVGPASAATPDPSDPPAPPGAAAAAPNVRTVTLVTGDRIQVDRRGPGQATVVETAPGTRSYTVLRDHGSLVVVPDQALPLLAAGRLDRRLFDVTALLEQGYDDAAGGVLPLIIEYAGGAGSARTAAASPLPGARVSRVLPEVGGLAAGVAKPEATAFWAAMGRGQARTLKAGAERIWLDGRVRANLDRSVRRVHGPAAWARGYDGRGVRVAVLDSGIDDAHPDLAGKVDAAANFTEEKDTIDHVGHGTHVASIVAGTGAASDGRYRGVAPGAGLLNGKVLQLEFVGPGVPTGTGQESWVIAGMEWAVAQGADIVNLSLGTPQRDGNDPLSRTVNALTARHGTLFVAAAGNSGPDHYSVESPANADAALAVGSIDRDDTISRLSSLGPRLVDGVVKPDVTAPGEEIAAARAADAEIGHPVGDRYAALTGTSMATPHVAGAAALLRQQHPRWPAGALRAALTSTAEFNPAYGVFEQGGGVIDLDRATRQLVRVEGAGADQTAGTLGFGTFAASLPPERQRATKTLTYRNDSAEPVTLSLSAAATTQSGEPAAAGTLSVLPETLTIPAGGSAQAAVTADVEGRSAGAYSGRVVATGPDGLSMGTPAGFAKQGAEVDVSFRAVDRRGRPAEASLIMRTPRAPNSFISVPVPAGGTYTVRLAAGDYTLLGLVRTPDESGRFDAELTVVADPEFDVAQPNRTVTLDARRARRLGVHVPRDVDVNGMTIGMRVERPELSLPLQESLILARGATYGTLPAVPMSILPFGRPRHGHGDIDTYWNLVSPRARAYVTAGSTDPGKRVPLPVALMDNSGRIDGSSELAVVDAGAGRPEDFAGRDVAGKLVLLRETDGLSYTAQAQAAAGHGAAAVLLSSAKPGSFFGEASAPIPVLAIGRAAGDELRTLLAAGPVRVTLSGSSHATYLYDLVFRERDTLGTNLIYEPGRLAAVRTGYHGMDAGRPQRFFAKRFPAPGAACGYCVVAAREAEDWHGGLTRTEYVTADLPWRESLLQDSTVQWSAVRSYPPGATTSSWGRAPVAPGVPIEPGIRSVRDGDRLRIRLAGFTDGDPTHVSNGFFGYGRYTSLSRDGVALGPCPPSGFSVLNCDVAVPPDRATFTLTADFPPITGSAVVPPSKTTWTFDSARGEAVLPLIDLDYDLPVSTSNTIRAGTVTSFRVAVRHQPGGPAGPIGHVDVRASYDDGATWVPLKTERQDGQWYVVNVREPALAATNGFVALRVSARDPLGNAVVQEVRRAYRLVAQ